jgi:hypothetical protein
MDLRPHVGDGVAISMPGYGIFWKEHVERSVVAD